MLGPERVWVGGLCRWAKWRNTEIRRNSSWVSGWRLGYRLTASTRRESLGRGREGETGVPLCVLREKFYPEVIRGHVGVGSQDGWEDEVEKREA